MATDPRATLRPPVSITAFHAAGLTTGLLDGASASTTLSTRNRMRFSVRQSSSTLSTTSPAALLATR